MKIIRILTSAFLFIFAFQLGPAFATNIEVLPQNDAYLITGGAIHYTNYTKDRREASNCTDCFWKIVEICKSWLDSHHGSCPWLRLQCPSDMQLVEVFRANALHRPSYSSKDWYFVSYSCIGTSGPISSVDIANFLSDTWIIQVPPLQIKYFPANDAILRLPLKYELQSASSFTQTRTLLGVKVTLQATSDLSFACLNSNLLTDCLLTSGNKIRFKKVGLFYLLASSQWSATYDALGVTGISVTGSQPVTTSKSIFNIHPLFTHLT